MNDQETRSFAHYRRARSRRFAIKAFEIFVLAHLYVGWRLLLDLPVDLGVQILGGAGLVLSALLIPFGTLARVFITNQTMIDRLAWAGGLTMGWFLSLLMLTLIRDVVLFIPGWRAWAPESAVLVLVLSIFVTMVGFFNARRLAKVIHVSIPLDDLPPELDGFTIAQITDVHIGPTIKREFVQGIVERVNALNPDVIAITGDIVDGSVAHLADDAAPLGRLRARHGAYVVTGNHEYHFGADEWMAAFRGLGLHPLMNAHVVIDHNGAQVVFAGINDFSTNNSTHDHVSDPHAAFSESPDGLPRILLAHQPRSAPAAEAAGTDLQLSGHTHGGQIWPWSYLVRLQQPYTAGLNRLGRMWIYTSRGTGYWGPPKRVGAPSEITLLTLSRPA